MRAKIKTELVKHRQSDTTSTETMCGSRKFRQGVLKTFLVINVFHREPYGPPSRSNWDVLADGVRTRISKETYSNL